LRSNKTNIPATVYLDNIVSGNINDTIKLFDDYFSSVYVDYSKNINLYDDSLLINHDINLSTWFISEFEIEDMLSALSVRSGIGPDGIPSSFLKACKSALIKPLFYLFYLSLSTGIFPDIST